MNQFGLTESKYRFEVGTGQPRPLARSHRRNCLTVGPSWYRAGPPEQSQTQLV
jgi:hypothetical protein